MATSTLPVEDAAQAERQEEREPRARPSKRQQVANRRRALELMPDCEWCGMSQAVCRCT